MGYIEIVCVTADGLMCKPFQEAMASVTWRAISYTSCPQVEEAIPQSAAQTGEASCNLR